MGPAICYSQCFVTFVRPPDIVPYMLADLYLPRILSFFLLFFRPLISKLAERNSTKIDHMVGSNCDLKTHVQNLEYALPLQIVGPKTILDDFTTTNLTVYVFGMKHDIDNRSSALTTSLQGSSQNFMNFGPQTASNWTAIFTHPL